MKSIFVYHDLTFGPGPDQLTLTGLSGHPSLWNPGDRQDDIASASPSANPNRVNPYIRIFRGVSIVTY